VGRLLRAGAKKGWEKETTGEKRGDGVFSCWGGGGVKREREKKKRSPRSYFPKRKWGKGKGERFKKT